MKKRTLSPEQKELYAQARKLAAELGIELNQPTQEARDIAMQSALLFVKMGEANALVQAGQQIPVSLVNELQVREHLLISRMQKANLKGVENLPTLPFAIH